MAANLQTLQAMNMDANLIRIREQYLFVFWVVLASGVGSFVLFKMAK